MGKTWLASPCGEGKPLGEGNGNFCKKSLQQIILVKESFERRESTNLSQSLVSFLRWISSAFWDEMKPTLSVLWLNSRRRTSNERLSLRYWVFIQTNTGRHCQSNTTTPHKVLLRKLWAISKKQGMFTKNVKNDPIQNKK